MLEGRNLLLYLSIKYEGDWDKIYCAIKAKEKISKEEVEEVVSTNKTPFITIIDDDYPNALKNIYKPPFVLFYYGDLSLLNNSNSFVLEGYSCVKAFCFSYIPPNTDNRFVGTCLNKSLKNSSPK